MITLHPSIAPAVATVHRNLSTTGRISWRQPVIRH